MRLVLFFLPSLVLSASFSTLAQSNLAPGETLRARASGSLSAWAENENGNVRLRAAGNFQATSSSRALAATHSIAFPLAFEANCGQAAGDVDFVAAGGHYRAELRANQIVLDLSLPADARRTPTHAVVRIALSGASANAQASGEGKFSGQTNYLFGSDPAKWITGVERYAKVRYRNVYPGIDVLFHGNQNRLEHDYLVHPGASPGRIRLGFEPGQRLELSSRGDLVLPAGDAVVRIEKPRAYQLVGDQRVEVSAEYEVRNRYVSFRLGPYNSRQALIIDPVLVYSTFLGGEALSANNAGVTTAVQGMAVDASGVYVTGNTSSLSFPVTSGVIGPKSGVPAFVTKLDPTGQSLIFSTYVAGFSYATALAVDPSHNVYIVGSASAGLPIPPGSHPFQSSPQGLAVLKLNSQGTAVLAATYLNDAVGFSGLAIDSADNVYLAGVTNSADFPLKNPLQNALGTSGQNAFVTELNPTLSGLVYSSYLGANSNVSTPALGFNQGIALDSFGDVYLIGTANAGFPVTSSAYESACAGSALPCPFLAKLNSSGSAILYATYLGFNGDSATAVAVDSSGDTYVAGATSSASFPVVNPIQSCTAIEGSGAKTPSGNFLTEFSPAGTLTFSTCLGMNLVSANGVYAFGPQLALDSSGNLYLAASAQAGFPLESPIDANPPASARPFVSELSATTHQLVFSSFVGGPVSYDGSVFDMGEAIYAIQVDSDGNIYLAGTSGAQMGYIFPAGGIAPGFSYLPVFNAIESYFFNPFNSNTCPPLLICVATDGFIMKISPAPAAAAALVPAELQFPVTGLGGTSAEAQAVTIYDLGTDPLTVSKAAAGGDFAIQSNNCATVSASGGSCSIAVTFKPTAAGTRNGTLTITDSSAGSPHTVVLTGITAGLGLGIAEGGSSSAAVAPGTSATYLLSIGGQGISGTASLSCKGAPTATKCSTPGTVSFSATSGTTFKVTVYTAASTMGKLGPSGFSRSPLLWAMAMMGCLVLPQRKVVRRRSVRLFPLFLSAFLLWTLCSCVSGGGPTPGGTYTLTVTAEDGSLSQSTVLTLTVQ
jgi:Beta-propeller repeat